MKYDLSQKDGRLRFIRRANALLRNRRETVELSDESGRSLSQNSYIHVLCRILAQDTGVTEEYAKQVYLKQLACPEVFCTATKDPLSGRMVSTFRSVADLTVPEMRRAIAGFRRWAAENGCYLPEASVSDDGSLSFPTEKEGEAFHRALIATSIAG